MKFFISVSLFNTSILLGQFVSPKTREKKERSKSTGENWKTDQNEEKVNDSEEKAEIKTSPFPYLPQAQQALPNYKPISVECPDAKKIHHPTTPILIPNENQAHDRFQKHEISYSPEHKRAVKMFPVYFNDRLQFLLSPDYSFNMFV